MPLTLALLLLCASPVFAEIPNAMLPEQPVGEPVVYEVGGGFPEAIAAGDSNFLIASVFTTHFVPYSAYAMLVDAEGKPLLRTSILLPANFTFTAAWSGREYLIVASGYEGEALGVRVDGEGNVLDATPIAIHPRGRFTGSSERAVVWDGGQFVVVMTTRDGVVAARLSESGDILQNEIPISQLQPYGVIAASSHGVTLFVWSDGTGTFMRTMNASGVLGPVMPGNPSHRLLAGTDGFLAAYASGDGIKLQRLNASGGADGAPATITVNSGWFRLVPSGSAYLLVYKDSNGVKNAARITSNGDFLEMPRIVDVPDGSLFASIDDKAVATWEIDAPGVPGHSEGITLAKSLYGSNPPQHVHRAFATQWNPMVTWSGDRFAAAWTEFGSGEMTLALASGPSASLTVSESIDPIYSQALKLYARIDGSAKLVELDVAGVVREGAPPLRTENPFTAQFVRAVWTGSDFIVVWARGTTEILGARIDASGKITNGPTMIANAKHLGDIAIGASSSQVLVVLQDMGIARGILLTPFGEIAIDDLTTAADRQFSAQSTSIASDGENFFVTWIDKSTSGPPWNDWIAGRLIDANGHAVNQVSGYSTGGDIKSIAKTIWNGSNYVVIGARYSLAGSTIFAARVARDGQLLDYPPVDIGMVDGVVTSIAGGPAGQIAIAYTKGARAYTRFIVLGRQRSAIHR